MLNRHAIQKAPQFPFPCAIQDCLAAYLYLIRPPPNSKHRAVDPKNLILAGDSAGRNPDLTLEKWALSYVLVSRWQSGSDLVTDHPRYRLAGARRRCSHQSSKSDLREFLLEAHLLPPVVGFDTLIPLCDAKYSH